MLAGIEEFVEMFSCIHNYSRVGDASTIEAERAGLAAKRGLQVGGRELEGCVQKSRST
ncbi:MAG: hypothetical protein JWP51_3582 [Bradyrhizobium sp.]|nr:hypothetical protein [Bradyrhizobium sp.]